MTSILNNSPIHSVSTQAITLPDIDSQFEWPTFPNSMTYRDLLNRDDIVKGWVSFDVVAFDPNEGKMGCVWAGLNVLNPTERSILRKYDLHTKTWDSIDLTGAIETFDLKIHKGINITKTELIFSTASFEDPIDQFNAPGGKIIVYDKKLKRVTNSLIPLSPKYGFPLSGMYIQSLRYDESTQKAYGGTYPMEVFFEWDRQTNKVNYLAHLTGKLGQPHNFDIDKDGNVWGTYGIGNGWSYFENSHPVRPFSYNPKKNSFNWFENIHLGREHLAQNSASDSLVICNDWVYFGDKSGNLNRVHADTNGNQYLGRVTSTGRVPALTVHDNCVWGTCGDFGEIYIFKIKSGGDFEFFGPIQVRDELRPERLHELTYIGNNTFMAGENDNHKRSSYMWEIKLKKM